MTDDITRYDDWEPNTGPQNSLIWNEAAGRLRCGAWLNRAALERGIAASFDFKPTSVHAVVSKAINMGWLARAATKANRNSIRATPAGRALRPELRP